MAEEPFPVSKKQCYKEQEVNNKPRSIDSGSETAHDNGDAYL